MTTNAPNPLARMADERRKTLKLLARSANLSHRWAAAAAGAAINHMVGAGHSLVQARDLCEEGGWLRWLRKNFEGSIRTAQRYMRIARHLPASQLDATCASPKSQTAVLRAIRGVVFTGPGGAEAGAPALAGPADNWGDDAAARRRLAFVAARRLRKLAGSLSAAAAGAHAAEFVERINALATDLLLDVGICAGTSGEVYFIEAVGADHVKIGISSDVGRRFDQLAASFPGPLKLLGRIAGGRAREASLHRRLANFHIGGEWFHLTPGVRAIIQSVIADDPE
ncbi:MAG TPA: GIY-YIG nuclease family protein [Pirellulales bacterium]|nr:GIY-YIG nuclease family protein [Pirellulales bacterium]